MNFKGAAAGLLASLRSSVRMQNLKCVHNSQPSNWIKMTEVRGQILTNCVINHLMSESIKRSLKSNLIIFGQHKQAAGFSTSNILDCLYKAADSLKLSAQVHKASGSFVCRRLTKRNSPAVWAQSTTCVSARFFHPSTGLSSRVPAGFSVSSVKLSAQNWPVRQTSLC